MATRLYSIPVGGRVEDVVEAAGSAVVTDPIELTVDLATSVVTEGASTRSVKKSEVLIALEVLAQYIVRSNWTPA